MSTQTYFDASGQVINLGKELGRGGEGAVFEVEDPALVAKIYHEQLSKEKQEKILNMVKDQSNDLVSVAAWPVQTIHSKKKGPVCGFFMGKATGYEPLHHLYSPTSRKQLFPEANWAFLIHTARNIATSIAIIHHRGHVVGDINQGNMFVNKAAVTKLIDCDSFQIHTNEKDYMCGVGVGHFIPPELQDLDLTNLTRTQNHDNFGLAVIIFHLIMMGRHPYSGIYMRQGDVTLEEAIKAHWYVYSPTAIKKGINRPPNSLSISILPEAIINLFLQAFSKESSESNTRPSAKQWMEELAKFEKSLAICDKVPIHRYWNGLKGCHWCEAELDKKVVFFIDSSLPTLSATFDFKKIRKQVADIRSPGIAPDIKVEEKIIGKPPPKRLVTAKRGSYVRKTVAGVVLVYVSYNCIMHGDYWIKVLIGAVPLCAWFAYFPYDKSKELSMRTLTYESINRAYLDIASDYRRDAGESRFIAQQSELSVLLFDYRDLPNWMEKAREELLVHVQEKQLNRFLSAFMIEDSVIPGIDESHKAVMASFEIENAADLDWSKVYNLKGFTTEMSNALLAWRDELMAKFVYDESKGIDKADEMAFMRGYYERRKMLESSIVENVQKLIDIKEDILKKRESMKDDVAALMLQRMQAKADLEIIEKF